MTPDSPLRFPSIALIAAVRGFEGSIAYPYLDTRGNCTVGVGHMVPDLASFRILPWANCTDDPEADWIKLKASAPGMASSYYAGITKRRLSPDSIDTILRTDLMEAWMDLQKLEPWVIAVPDPQGNALWDMSFNLGAFGLTAKFPHFLNAMHSSDWAEAAAQCTREGVQESRNVWTRAQLIGGC